MQPCQFRFLTNHCQARAANPRKQPEKLGWESGVFSGALRNAFRDPTNSPEKSPEKSSGPRSFRVFWETHARGGSREWGCALPTPSPWIRPCKPMCNRLLKPEVTVFHHTDLPAGNSGQIEAVVHVFSRYWLLLKALTLWLLLGIRTVFSKLSIVLWSNKGLPETFRHGQVLTTVSHTNESSHFEEQGFHFNFPTDKLILVKQF